MSTDDGRRSLVVLVTGGGTGLGAATARHLASLGDRVHVAGRRPERVDEVVAAITAAGGRANGHRLDVTHAEECRQVVADVVAAEGRVDVLVNNAGVFRRGTASGLDPADWDETLAINLTGAMHMLQAVVAACRTQALVDGARGHVINVNSGAGLTGYRDGAAYTASKFGLMGFSDALRQEVAPLGVKVTDLVVATAVHSELSSRVDETRLPADTVAQVVANVVAMPGPAVIDRVDLGRLPVGG